MTIAILTIAYVAMIVPAFLALQSAERRWTGWDSGGNEQHNFGIALAWPLTGPILLVMIAAFGIYHLARRADARIVARHEERKVPKATAREVGHD